MKAIEIEGTGNEARLVLGEVADPTPGEDEVLIEVKATAINRADILQRKGFYPPPPGASEILGLECSGVVSELGDKVDNWAVGDPVCALLTGGGYAEKTVAHKGSIIAVPERVGLTEAAALPEVFLTCSLNLFQIGDASTGDWALVHGGGSGIGTAAIQLLRHSGVKVIVTAGSDSKCDDCETLGAHAAINYRNGDFAARVLEITEGNGVDVVLDSIGAPYLSQHLECLAAGGRLVLIGLMGGAETKIDLGLLLRKRLSIHGSTLRTRPAEEKARIVSNFLQRFGPAIETGSIHPVVQEILPLEEAQRAHGIMEASTHFGKLVLRVRE
jgi:putative PIG3 family NAD(P)H quinone oxidoreductase